MLCTQRCFRRVAAWLATVGILGASGPAQATTFTWLTTSSSAGFGDFSSPASWSGGVVPPGTAPDTLTFSSGTVGYVARNDLTSALVLNTLSLISTTTNYLVGNALQFTGTTPHISQTTTGQANIANNIDMPIGLTIGGAGTGIVALGGTISGAGNLAKSGASTYVLRGINSYTGSTTVSAGTLIAATDVIAGLNGALGNNASAVTMAGGTLGLAGQVTLGRGVNVTGSSTLSNNTLGIATASGSTAISTGTLTLQSVVGGSLLATGTISGVGNVILGASGVTGTVRISGANTYSGTTAINFGRVAILADTVFTGPANNPTTITSGPLGTGTVSFATTTFIQAGGADRTIVNALGTISATAASTLTFAGTNSLTLTRDWNINSSTAGLIRTFAVFTNPGVVTFSGNLTQTNTAPLAKSGLGTLVLSGTNTFSGGLTVSGGVLSFSSDTNLGAAPGAFSATNISLGGGTLRATGSTPISLNANRGFTLTAASTIAVAPGQTLTIPAAIVGAFGLTVAGGGTLSLNGTAAQTSSTVSAGSTLTSGASSGTPFGSVVNLNSAMLGIAAPTASTALTTTTLAYQAGSIVSLADSASFSAQFTATNLNRTGNGVLTIVSANNRLGQTGAPGERLIATNVLGVASSSVNVAGSAIVPASIITAISDGTANFVTYGTAAQGFTPYNLAGAITSLSGVNPTSVADINSAESLSGTNDVYAVRTSADIASGLLRIASVSNTNQGGLLINGGAAAPQITSNLFFGNLSTGSAGEALVYVKGGYGSGTATLGGSITATDFTKFGPGALLISGSAATMAPTGTGLRNFTIQQGTVQFGSSTSVPTANFAINDTGTLDLADLNLTLAGLSGSGVIGNSSATTASVLTMNSNNQTTTFSGAVQNVLGAGASTVSLVKSGSGTLVLNGRSTYSGGTTINAGSITSGAGLFTSTGVLQVTDPLGLGSGPITLAGGTLDLRYDGVAIMDVIKGLNIATFGPGSGYDVTIAATNNFGQANTTSTINAQSTTAGASLNIGLNNLTLNSQTLSITGANTFGVRFGGTTTLSGNTTFNVLLGGSLVLDGQIAGVSNTITKIGAGTLVLSNAALGTDANALGATTVAAGVLDVRLINNGSNPLGSTAPIIRSGGSLTVRHDGDGTASPELISTGMSIVVNSPTASGTSRTSSGNSTLTASSLGAATLKTLSFDNLTINSVQGAPTFTVAASPASYSVQFGTTSFSRDVSLAFGAASVTHQGVISGYGTLFRPTTATGNLYINAANTYTGGTILAGGNTFFGSFMGAQFNPNTAQGTTARLGPGNVLVLPGAAIQFNESANRNGVQTVEVRSNLASLGVLRLAGDITPAQVGLRASFSGYSTDLSTGSPMPIATGALAINHPNYTQALNLASIGDGTWFLGSTQNGIGQNGVYNAASLGVGAGNVYRLGAGSVGVPGAIAVASLTIAQANVLSGSAGLQVGSPLLFNTQAAIGNVILAQSQNYGGLMTVNRSSSLEFRGTALGTAAIDVFGTFSIGGAAGSLANVTAPITLRPGSTLRFDNTLGALNSRWQLSAGTPIDLTLNGATLALVGNSAALVTQPVGAITLAGGSAISIQRLNAAQTTTLTATGLNRAVGQTLTISPVTSAQLGVSERFSISVPANQPAVTNGMVAPWMINATESTFLTYGANGFANIAAYTTQAVVTLASTLGTGIQVYDVTGAVILNAGVNINAWAMRTNFAINKVGTAPFTGTQTISLGSGGLISSLTTQNVITANLNFASGGEGIIYNGSTGGITIGDFTSATGGQITASSLTKFGPGVLQLDSAQQSFSGNIYVNGGSLNLRSNVALGGSTFGGQQGGTGANLATAGNIVLNAAGVTLNLRSDLATATTPVANGQTTVTTIFQNNLVLAQDVSLATVNVALAVAATPVGQTIALAGGLTFEGESGNPQGQTLTIANGNTYGLQINGVTTFGGASVLNNAAPVTLAGPVTGAGQFSKTGIGTLFLSNLSTITPNDFSGGIQIQAGAVSAYATGTNPTPFSGSLTPTDPFNNSTINVTSNSLSSGAITLYGGTLNLLVDGTQNNPMVETAVLGNDVMMAGNTTITVQQRTATGGTAKRIALGDLTIGNQTITVSGANLYSLRFNDVTLRGNATFNIATAASPLLLNGTVSDGGGSAMADVLGAPLGTSFAITKSGGGDLYFNTNASSLRNGIIVNGGVLRTGTPYSSPAGSSANTAYPNLSVTFGTGLIQLNAGGGVRLDSAATLVAGQQVLASSSATNNATVRLNSATAGAGSNFSMALLQNILTPDSTSGTIGIEGAGLSGVPLNMALIGDGTWYLSASLLSSSFNGPILPGAPATPGGLPAFRWTAAFSQFSVSAANVFTGDARLVSGGYAVGALGGTSSIYNASNSFTGGTDMMRGQSTGQVGGAIAGVPSGNPVWGTGAIEVYGAWTMFQLGTVAASNGLNNLNVTNFHPGSSLTFTPDTSAFNTNRWGNTAPISLNGTTLIINNSAATANSSELLGQINFARGSQITLRLQGTPTGSTFLQSGSGTLTREGNGTLTIITDVSTGGPTLIPNNLGNITSTFQRLILASSAALPAPLTAQVNSGAGGPTGMAPAYIVNATDLTYVSYNDTTGFQNLVSNTTAPAAGQVAYSHVVNVGSPNFPTGLTAGTATVDVNVAATLSDNPSVFALRTGSNISNGPGQINTISIASDAANQLFGGLLLAGTVTVNPNLTFGGGTGEAPIFANVTATLTGDISAGVITKFGAGTLVIAKDQTGYANGWIVNQGGLTANTFGALGHAVSTNTVTLNGPMTLTLAANSGNTLNNTYTSGTIYSVDDGRITYTSGGDDRTATISDIVIQNTAPGISAQDARITFSVGTANRTILNTGVLSLTATQVGGNSNAVVSVSGSIATSTGVGSGVFIPGLVGTDSNTTLRKWGNGTLYVDGNNSATWTGITSIEQGAVQVLSQNALGAPATSTIRVLKNGVLDIGVSGFTRTQGITYAYGSGERWSVDNARVGVGAPSVVNLGKATLQIGADQASSTPGTLTVQLNGGSIEGFLRNDDVLTAVYRTVGTGIGFELLGDSFLGQNVLQGTNGVDNGRSPTAQSPLSNTVTGAVLELQGAISGIGSLTKVSLDTVVLSGASTYTGGTNVTAGVLRLGYADNRLPTNGRLFTSSGGVFDLSGFNQIVGSLVSAHGMVSGLPTDGGYIYNSATTNSNLSVGSASSTTYSYGGIIQGNVSLTKLGGRGNVLQLLGPNTYNGGTFLNGGVISIASESALGDAGGPVVFDGGALRITASTSLARALTLAAGGGAIEVAAGQTVGLSSSISGSGGLTLRGHGTLQVFGNNTYAGPTTIEGGVVSLDVNGNAPLGTGTVTMSGGELQLIGGLVPSTISFGGLKAAGGGKLVIDSGSAISTATFADLARSDRGTLVIVPQSGAFGSDELIALTSAPALTHGIVAPWAAMQTSGSNTAGDFLTVVAGTLAVASYSGAGNLNTATATDVFNVTSPSTLSANRAVFALKTSQTIDGLFALTVGDGVSPAGILLNGATIATSTLDLGGSEGMIYAGVSASVIGAAITGSTGITKFGPELLTLSGANTFAGGLTINGGALAVSRNANLGIGGDVSLSAGTLQTSSSFVMTHGFQLLSAGGSVQVAAGTAVVVKDNITGRGTFNKLGAGLLVVDVASAYTGNTTIAAGKLRIAADNRLGDANALLTLGGGTLQTTASFSTARALSLGTGGGGFDVAEGTTLTYSGNLEGVGSLTKSGAGTLVLSGRNLQTGGLTVNGGTLSLTGENVFSGPATLNFGAFKATAVVPGKSPFGSLSGLTIHGGTFQLTGIATDSLSGINGPLTVAGGASVLLKTIDNNATLAMEFASLARSGSGTLVVVPTSGNLNNTTQSFGVAEFLGFKTAPTVTNTIIAPWAVRQASESDSTGNFLALTGTFVQSAAYSAITDLNTSVSTTVYNATTTSTNAITANRAAYAVKVNSGVTVSGGFTLTVGGTSGQAGVILNGGQINTTTLAFGTQEAVVYAGGAIASSIGANITGSGGFTKFGPQTLTLTGTNTFTGTLSLNGGVLAVSADNKLGGAAAMLHFNGGTLQPTASFTANRTTVINPGLGVIDTPSGVTFTLSGAVSGSGGLVKQNAGTLVLSNTNTYAGGTYLNDGVVSVATDQNLGNADGELTFGGGTLQYSSPASSNRAITLNSGGGVIDTQANDVVLSGYISGTGGLTKQGSGTLTYTGLGFHTGTTTIAGGTLALTHGDNTNLPSSPQIIVGDTLSNASAALNVSGIVGPGGFELAAGQTLSGFGTVVGNTTATSGSVLNPGTVGAVGTLSTSALAFNSGSAFNLDLGAGAGNADKIAATGAVTIAGGATINFNVLSALDQLQYVLLSSTSGISGAFTGAAPSGYQLVYTANDVILNQIVSTSGTIAIDASAGASAIITGGSLSLSGHVANTAVGGSGDLNYTLGGSTGVTGLPSGTLTRAAGDANAAAGAAYSGTFTSTTLGNNTVTITATDPTATNNPQSASFNVNVLDHATIGAFAGGTVNVGNLHVGYAGAATSNSLAVTNGAGTDNRVNLKGGAVPSGNLSLSSINAVAPGGTGSINATLATGQGVGAINQAFTYTFADDSVLSGASANIGQVSINVTGQIYSGLGVWNTDGGGSWNDFAKWQATGGTPGIDGALSAADTATFGGSLVSAPATVTLDGVAPSLSALTFNAAQGYAIGQGSGSHTLTLDNTVNGSTPIPVLVSAGSHTISAPVALASNALITITGSLDQLTISGAISGNGKSLTKAGAGSLVLSGANTYTGGTTVDNNGHFVLDGTLTSDITISSGSTLGGHGSTTGAISGTGLVGPGNSPGILTAAQSDPTGGLDFDFEFTLSSGVSPIYANASNSGNDMLRLTGATPFTSSLSSGNVVSIYLQGLTLNSGDTFRGGFYTDAGNFLSSINGATFQYFLDSNPLSAANFSVGVLPDSANFGGGTVNGYITQITYSVTAVPEPGSMLLAGLAAASMAGWQWRRRRSAQSEQDAARGKPAQLK